MKKSLIIFIYFFITQIYGQNIPYNKEIHFNSFGNLADIVSISNNNILITEHSKRNDGKYHIVSQIYDLVNQQGGDVFQVSTNLSESQYTPTAAALSNDGFVITWEDEGKDGSSSGIFAQLYDKNYVKLGDNFKVNSHIWDWQHYQKVGSLLNNSFVITWQSEKQDGSGAGIYAQIFKNTGGPEGGELQVNTFTSGEQIHPSVKRVE